MYYFELDGATIHVRGASCRFPFRQHWKISANEENAIKLDIDFEAMEDLSVQEYHTSVLLVEDFTAWSTAEEQGEFPDIRPDAADWVHLNKSYGLGEWVKASGAGVPSVVLESGDPSLRMRMTVLNPDFQQRSRVLQALRTPDHGQILFSKGRHPFFRGRIAVKSS